MARSRKEHIRRNISQYLSRLRYLSIEVNGKDLQEPGHRARPHLHPDPGQAHGRHDRRTRRKPANEQLKLARKLHKDLAASFTWEVERRVAGRVSRLPSAWTSRVDKSRCWYVCAAAPCEKRRILQFMEVDLWAPWRLNYILGPKPEECVFCIPEDTVRGRGAVHSGPRRPLFRDHEQVSLQQRASHGHPYRHVSNLTDLSLEESNDCMLWLSATARIYWKKLSIPRG